MTEEIKHPVDEDGFDNVLYWVGHVRMLYRQLLGGNAHKFLDGMILALREGKNLDVSVQIGSRDRMVAVWALTDASATVVWGVPCFHPWHDYELVLAELEELVAEAKTRFMTFPTTTEQGTGNVQGEIAP
jgi:hypothetical protein